MNLNHSPLKTQYLHEMYHYWYKLTIKGKVLIERVKHASQVHIFTTFTKVLDFESERVLTSVTECEVMNAIMKTSHFTFRLL